jgi:hypothetical protein
MKTKLMVVAVAAALSYSAAGLAALSKEERKAEEDRISADYKTAKAQCSTLKGNAKDICLAQADGANKVASAELEARDKGTLKAQSDARIARAEAEYMVARERCDDAAGNVKDVCVADAKAMLARAKADAKVERESKEANRVANERVADAQQAAAKETARADYDAARERCDRYAGDTRDRCVGDAKARFGR